MISAILEYQFMRHAMITCLLSGITCGIIGVIIIEKKLIMMSGGIAHTAFGGVGLGYLLGFEPIIGAFIFSVLSSLGIGFVKRRGGARTDVIIGLLWSFGMACGVFFIGLKKGLTPDIGSYLFGNILSVLKTDIYLMIALTILVVFAVTALYSHWKSYLFDQEFATVSGINTTFLEYFLLVLIAMTVVVLIRSVGIILVMALLTAPAATASLFTKKLKSRILVAIFFSLIFSFIGLWLSYSFDIASGASIVFVSAVTYMVILVINTYLKKRREIFRGRKNVGY